MAEQSNVNDILLSKGVSSEEQKERSPLRKFFGTSLAFVVLLEVLLVIVFGVFSKPGTFMTINNLTNILANSAQMIIIAVGLTYVISSGHFDLSVGMNLILCSVVGAKVFKMFVGTTEEINAGQYPHMARGIIMACLVSVLIGMISGALNAFSISKLKLPPFIATLATMYILQGTAMVICNGAQEKQLPRTFQYVFGHAKLFNVIPYQSIVAIIIGLILNYIMKYTQFGLDVRALGSNKESTRRAGIKVDLVTFKIFMLMGVLCAVAGIFDVTRFATTNPSGHQTDSMMAIMAVVMGGTSLSGGIASIGGTMLAVLVPVTLQAGMIILGLSSFYQLIAMGIFLIIAVYLDYWRNMRPRA